MYVCLCRRVTDRCVEAAIAAGARDVDAVGRLCRAGTGCGGCRPLLEALVAVAHHDGAPAGDALSSRIPARSFLGAAPACAGQCRLDG
ncbi:MAG: (2Fe-2S)-binding protein [Acidimicrobiales bacterium]